MTPSRWLRLRILLIDRPAAAVLSVVTAPVVAAIAWAVRRDGDAAPPLIRLTRVGQGRRLIRVWKVRTMFSAGVDGSAGGPAITRGDGDDRITPIGRRLRRYRLDELPQVWNVVVGSMALLAPRPETPSYVAADDGRWDAVLAVPPGIAGPTQLLVQDWEAAALESGEGDLYGETILPVKLAIDRWYVGHASPRVDLLVATALLQRFLLGRPPVALADAVRGDVPELAAVPPEFLDGSRSGHSG